MSEQLLNENGVQVEDAVVEIPVYPEFESDPPKKHRKRKVFWKIFVAYFSLLLVLGVIALWFLYRELEHYETTTPNTALNAYVNWIHNGDFESIYAASDFTETVLNTKEEYIKYLARVYDGDKSSVTVREKVTSTEERKEYSVYMGDRRVSGFSLIKNPAWGETAWSYETEVQYLPPVTIFAAEEIRLSVNGTEASLLNLSGTPVQNTVFGVSEETDLLPIVYSYTIESLLNPPTIDGLTLSGDVCTVKQDEQGVYHVQRSTSENTQTEREELAKEVAFTYAKFISRDAKREDLLKKIAPSSELYQKIKVFSNDWFSRHDTVEFRDVTIANYAQYSGTDFSCEVRFNPVYLRGGQEKETGIFHNRMNFVLVDGEWQLFNMTQLNEETAEPTTDTPES